MMLIGRFSHFFLAHVTLSIVPGGFVKASSLRFNDNSISMALNASLPVRFYLSFITCLLQQLYRLKLFGFSGRDKGGYYHELFLRSKAFLAYRIPRTKLKNEGARKSTSPETEPNFYVLPFLPEEAPRTTNRLQGVFAASSSAATNVANESKTATSQGGMDAILPPSFLTGLDRWSGADLAALRPLVPPVADAWTSSSNALFHPAAAGSLSGGMADPSALLWTQLAYQQALAPGPSYRASGVPQWPGTPWIANDELNALRLALARNYTAASSVDQLLRNAAAGANLP